MLKSHPRRLYCGCVASATPLVLIVSGCSSDGTYSVQRPTSVQIDMGTGEWSVHVDDEVISMAELPHVVPIQSRLTNGTVYDGIYPEPGSNGAAAIAIDMSDNMNVRIRVPRYCEYIGSSWKITEYRSAYISISGKEWKVAKFVPLEACVSVRRPGSAKPTTSGSIEGEKLQL